MHGHVIYIIKTARLIYLILYNLQSLHAIYYSVATKIILSLNWVARVCAAAALMFALASFSRTFVVVVVVRSGPRFSANVFHSRSMYSLLFVFYRTREREKKKAFICLLFAF